MLKNILLELRDLVSHLEATGYFHQRKLSLPKKKRREYHRGPDTQARVHGNKLTRQEAIEIYNDHTSYYNDLAAAYGVTTRTIHHIKSGRSWSLATGHKK